MRRFWLAVGAFLGALIITWFAAIGVYILGTSMGWLFDRDGGVAMGFGFVIGPFFGIVMGLVAALVVLMRSKASPPKA